VFSCSATFQGVYICHIREIPEVISVHICHIPHSRSYLYIYLSYLAHTRSYLYIYLSYLPHTRSYLYIYLSYLPHTRSYLYIYLLYCHIQGVMSEYICHILRTVLILIFLTSHLQFLFLNDSIPI